MTRCARLARALLAWALLPACRQAPPAAAQPSAPPAQDAALEPAPRPPAPAPLLAQADRSGAPALAPAPADALPCERACGEVHGCLLALEFASPSAASSLELACLEACLDRSPRAGQPFGCEAPRQDRGRAELLVGCELYLSCVEAGWVEPTPRRIEIADASEQRGCARACLAFAACRGVDLQAEGSDALGQCVELCDAALDEEQEQAAGECTELEDCERIQLCVQTLVD